MIASLGMYDMPHARGAHDRYWAGIRRALGRGPDRLDRSGDLWSAWRSSDLFLSQTCGLPFRAELHEKVTLIGTPDYGLLGCPPGYYNSVLLVRSDNPAHAVADLARPKLAYNEALSQSGWAAPYAYFQNLGLEFEAGPQTGSHAASAAAVARGAANIAAVDALTWAMLQREASALSTALKVIDRTPPTPGLPYITAKLRDADPIAQAVAEAIDGLDSADRATLHLRALVNLSADVYLKLPIPPQPCPPRPATPKKQALT